MNVKIESYETETQAGNEIRIEGSGWSETVAVPEGDEIVDAVESYLGAGDYDEGGEERRVVVRVDGEYFATYSAPEIRELQEKQCPSTPKN
jgi:hypothetical protein